MNQADAAGAPTAQELLSRDFGSFAEVFARQVVERAGHPAVVAGETVLTYAQFGDLTGRIAAGLQRDGLAVATAAAMCAEHSTPELLAAYVGALRAGVAATPLAPSSTPEALAAMVADSGAPILFLDKATAQALEPVRDALPARRVALDGSDAGIPLAAWLPPTGTRPASFEAWPDQPFNIIYSSGTTGAPKGIVQPYAMRWAHVQRVNYSPSAVTLVSTPLYSNTTLVSVLPTLAKGGTVVLMPRFDPTEFLRLAERWRVTHAMLVPVQYRRILAEPDFDTYDLSSFEAKYATSAPFPAELKAETLARWPGGLIEFFGMTEGGATFVLAAHDHPDKLHTVGRPLPGHEVRLIGDDGREAAPGDIGEVVGRSPSMMAGYHNRPEKSREAEWISPEGVRYIRTGDIGRFDADGFFILLDRKKDMIISGGFNVFPSDLEAVLAKHPAVAEAAVVGVASTRWGETPVAFVAPRPGETVAAGDLREWANARLGKTQRLADLVLVEQLPRSPIGKILKRELREAYSGPACS